MSTMEQEIERVLRAAPKSAPPAGLKERLLAQVRLPGVQPASQAPASPLTPGGWLRRWWPLLAPATVSLACAVGLVMQQIEIRNLRQAIRGLTRDSAGKPGVGPVPASGTNDALPGPDAAAQTQQEIARLKVLAGQLAGEVAQLERLRAENVKLRTELAAPPAGLLKPEETEALAWARERAESIACVNNLKQLGLAMRTWAIDNAKNRVELPPPDILCMSNEVSVPKVLVCPADRAREAAKDWASYTPANCSYEYLVSSTPDWDIEPQRVAFRCPIHGHVGLCDGSAQRGIAKEHPERLVQRGGKLYLVDPAEPDKAAPASQPANPPPGGTNP
jgi:hypothetical protein